MINTFTVCWMMTKVNANKFLIAVWILLILRRLLNRHHLLFLLFLHISINTRNNHVKMHLLLLFMFHVQWQLTRRTNKVQTTMTFSHHPCLNLIKQKCCIQKQTSILIHEVDRNHLSSIDNLFNSNANTSGRINDITTHCHHLQAHKRQMR